MRQHNLRILFFLLVLWGVAVACSRREARFRIGVSQCSEDEWRRQMNSEILREAHFYEDVEVDIRTAVDDNDRQAKDIRELIAEGVDLLIVAPNEATPITPVVEEAYNRGIPVIVVDRKILSDKYTECGDKCKPLYFMVLHIRVVPPLFSPFVECPLSDTMC